MQIPQSHPSVELVQTIGHHRTGRLAEAERGYRSVLANDPDQPDALNLLGVVLCQKGACTEGLAWIDRAIARMPYAAAYHGNRGEVLRELGQLEGAESALKRAIELDPGLATAYNNLGLVYVRGHPVRFAEALAALETAIRLDPSLIQARCNLADLFVALDRLPEAIDTFRALLAINPDHSWALLALGQLLLDIGASDCLDEAAQLCRRACALSPERVEPYTNLGNVLTAMGQFDEAEAAYRRAIALSPGCALAWNNLGLLYQRVGRWSEAEEAAERALSLEPGSPKLLAARASLLSEEGRLAEAIDLFEQALKRDPEHVESLSGLGKVYYRQGRGEEARAALGASARLRPSLAAPRIQLARLCAEAGEFDASNAHARAALECPFSAEAFFVIAMNLRGRLPDHELDAMIQALGRKNLGDADAASLAFGAGTVLDARGRFEEAAHLFEIGNARQSNQLVRLGRAFEPERASEVIAEIIEAYTPEFFRTINGLGSSSPRPIFVVGMPRSGTTLVEQMLASHPEVHGAGEIEDIANLERQISPGMPSPRLLAKTLRAGNRATIDSLAQRYFIRLEELGGRAVRVVDKMPDNFYRLGMIATLFPEAKIVICLRDMRDVALSCWVTYFGEVSWASDLRNIATRITHHDQILEHWRAVLPRAPIEIRYETLVDNLELETRRLLDALELPWNSRCLDFHSLERTVRTASLNQVRSPLHRGSVGRWKPYRKSLQPLFATLAKLDHPLGSTLA